MPSNQACRCPEKSLCPLHPPSGNRTEQPHHHFAAMKSETKSLQVNGDMLSEKTTHSRGSDYEDCTVTGSSRQINGNISNAKAIDALLQHRD